jgi:hypothetical protein
MQTDKFTRDQIGSVIDSNCKYNKIEKVKRIFGGYSKYTYEIILDRSSYIFQIWTKPVDQNETVDICEDDFLYPGGIDNYCHVNAILTGLKIRTPKMHFIDNSKSIIPFTCSLSQFIEIDSFNGFDEHKKKGTDKIVLEEFGESFAKLKRYSRNYPGTSINGIAIDPL